jgi:recombination protein RecA
MSKNWLSALLKDEKNLQGSAVSPKARVILPSPSLNWALGGGFYKGYTTCLYGPEQSGKSLIGLMAIGALHQSDPEAYAVLISAEMRPPDPERAKLIGVDPDRLIIRQANTLHDVFDWVSSPDSEFKNSDGSKGSPGMRYLLQEGAPIKGLMIDSIKSIQGPKEQNAESAEKDIMGDMSKFLNPALRNILPVIRQAELMTILIQQVNMNMNPDEVKYQNKKYTIPSGMALKHFCESMILVERVESKDSKIFSEELKGIRDLPLQEGHTIRAKVEKANLDAPFREAEFRLNYTKGIVDIGLEIAKLAVGLGLIKHPLNDKGAEIVSQWLFKDKKWIGFDKAVTEIETTPELQRAILAEIYKEAE